MPRERHVLQALFISWSFHFKFHIQTWFNTLLFTLGHRYVICDHCAEFLFLLAFCKLPHSFRCITTTLWTRVKPRRMQTDLGSGQLEAQILYVDEYQITSGFHLDMRHLTSVNGASFLYHSTLKSDGEFPKWVIWVSDWGLVSADTLNWVILINIGREITESKQHQTLMEPWGIL